MKKRQWTLLAVALVPVSAACWSLFCDLVVSQLWDQKSLWFIRGEFPLSPVALGVVNGALAAAIYLSQGTVTEKTRQAFRVLAVHGTIINAVILGAALFSMLSLAMTTIHHKVFRRDAMLALLAAVVGGTCIAMLRLYGTAKPDRTTPTVPHS